MWKTVIFILCLLPVSLLAQSITFESSTNATRVSEQTQFEVSFTIKNTNRAGQGVDFPTFRDFEVLGGPSEYSQMSITNGKRTSQISYTFILSPKRTGRLTIQSARVKIDGKEYVTKPLIVTVVEAKEGEGTARPDIFLQALPENETIYIGQQIALDYKIFFTTNINSYSIEQESEYPGFYVEDIRQIPPGVVREFINETQYTTKVLKRVALFPQQTGRLDIDPMQMKLGIAQGGQRNVRDFFYSPQIYRMNINTDPLALNVLPLPDNPPASFTGAVGDYTFSASLEQNQVTTDDVINFRVAVGGDGDIKRVQPPVLNISDDFEIYEPELIEERSGEIDGRLQSRQVYEFIAVPKREGTYQAQLEFTYFSPDSAAYITQQSSLYQVRVKPGVNYNPNKSTDRLIKDTPSDIRFIKSVTNFQSDTPPFAQSMLFWSLAGLPILLFFSAVAVKKAAQRREDIDPMLLRQQRAQKMAKKHLTAAQTHLTANDSRAFYNEVSKAMLGYVNDKLNIRNSELTKDNVIETLQSLGASETPIKRFMDIIQTCEMALFARQDNTQRMQETYDQAMHILVDIEGEIKR